MKKEIRNLNLQDENTQLRALEETDGKRFITGYAAVFESRSSVIVEPVNGKKIAFYEFMERGSFDGVMEDNVKALVNHNKERLLGRTSSGTLTLTIDERGLHFRLDVPNTTEGNDLWEMIKRGDYEGCSFAFVPAEQRWERGEELPHRYIERVAKLVDISIVTDPAYSETNVDIDYAQRSIDELDKDEEIRDDYLAEIDIKTKQLQIYRLTSIN